MRTGLKLIENYTKKGGNMAKCIKIKSTGQVIRVPDNTANDAVQRGVAEFAPKSDWKEAGRINMKDERGISRG